MHRHINVYCKHSRFLSIIPFMAEAKSTRKRDSRTMARIGSVGGKTTKRRHGKAHYSRIAKAKKGMKYNKTATPQ